MSGFFASAFTAIVSGVRRLFALVLPTLAKAGDYRGWSRTQRIVAGLIVLFIIELLLWLIGLTQFGKRLENTFIKSQDANVQQLWLPALFLLIVALSYLMYYYFGLSDDDVSFFPDIDEAWDEAVEALRRNRISLTEPPLFLVLGGTVAGEEALFRASGLRLAVSHAPDREAPLHVYANRDGIYVTCAGTSLLGRLADLIAGRGSTGSTPVIGDGGEESSDLQSVDPWATIVPSAEQQKMIEIIRRAAREKRELTAEEKKELEKATTGTGAKPPMIKDLSQVRELRARLRHLCRLIARDRYPYCPANGILLLIPLGASLNQESADHAGSLCEQDLTSARAALRLHCPVFALFCDLETATGFPEFIAEITPEQRRHRFGRGLPLVPALKAGESAADLVDRTVRWVCDSYLPSWVFKLLRIESGAVGDFATAVAGNERLSQFLCFLRERGETLSRILVRGLQEPRDGLLLFGGCYFAATGDSAVNQQLFLPGIFHRLLQHQSFVSWTDETLRANARDQLKSWLGYGLIVAVIAACVIYAFLRG